MPTVHETASHGLILGDVTRHEQDHWVLAMDLETSVWHGEINTIFNGNLIGQALDRSRKLAFFPQIHVILKTGSGVPMAMSTAEFTTQGVASA